MSVNVVQRGQLGLSCVAGVQRGGNDEVFKIRVRSEMLGHVLCTPTRPQATQAHQQEEPNNHIEKHSSR